MKYIAIDFIAHEFKMNESKNTREEYGRRSKSVDSAIVHRMQREVKAKSDFFDVYEIKYTHGVRIRRIKNIR